eukprot:gene24906-biopygen7439
MPKTTAIGGPLNDPGSARSKENQFPDPWRGELRRHRRLWFGCGGPPLPRAAATPTPARPQPDPSPTPARPQGALAQTATGPRQDRDSALLKWLIDRDRTATGPRQVPVPPGAFGASVGRPRARVVARGALKKDIIGVAMSWDGNVRLAERGLHLMWRQTNHDRGRADPLFRNAHAFAVGVAYAGGQVLQGVNPVPAFNRHGHVCVFWSCALSSCPLRRRPPDPCPPTRPHPTTGMTVGGACRVAPPQIRAHDCCTRARAGPMRGRFTPFASARA